MLVEPNCRYDSEVPDTYEWKKQQLYQWRVSASRYNEHVHLLRRRNMILLAVVFPSTCIPTFRKPHIVNITTPWYLEQCY